MNEANETAPLHRPIWDGDLSRVQHLLDAGADPNARDPNDWTPLSRAIERRQPQIALLLIERGADCKATDRRRRTPLHWTAQYRSDVVAERLLEQGAEAAASDSHGITPLAQASRHGHTAIVRMLLQQGKWARPMKGWYWTEGFFLAIRNRHPDTVAAFLDAGQPVDSTAHRYNVSLSAWHLSYTSTALMEAIATRDLRTVALLLHRGADISKKFRRHSALTEALASYGEDAAITRTLFDRGAVLGLEEAVVVNDLALAERLLTDGADPEAPDDDGQTLLTWAALRGQANAARLLVRFGANSNPKPLGEYRAGPLAGAAATGDIALMEFLVAHGADANAAVERWQATPLEAAASANQIAAMHWLTDRFGLGADGGAQALIWAAASNRFEAVHFLLDAGVDVNARSTRPEPSSTYYGRTALMYAVWYGSPELSRFLLDRGADARYTDGRGRTALSFVISEGRKRVIPLLVTRMIAQGMIQEQKNKALILLLKQSDMVELLLKDGADPNAATPYDRYTLLMRAARQGEASLVQLLLDKGAATDAVDKDGKTALDYAEQAGRADIAALLRQHAPSPRES